LRKPGSNEVAAIMAFKVRFARVQVP